MDSEEKKLLEKIFKIANNVLYFDDNSDYASALFEIATAIKSELDPYTEIAQTYLED